MPPTLTPSAADEPIQAVRTVPGEDLRILCREQMRSFARVLLVRPLGGRKMCRSADAGSPRPEITLFTSHKEAPADRLGEQLRVEWRSAFVLRVWSQIVSVLGSIERCEMVDLPKISDPRGNLTFVEANNHVPFDIERAYYLYDIPGGAVRGGHAHKELRELIIAMSGSFDVVLDEGYGRERIHLNRSYSGLFVGPMVWRELDNFSSGSVCLVLASTPYDESDYYRDYGEFQRALRQDA